MHNHDEHEHHHHHDTEATDIPADRMATCPVTGDAIDTAEAEKLGHYRDYNGKRIYLCCATCVQLFDENPEKYAHKSHESRALTLTEKVHLVDNIWAFRFTSDQPFSWIPGQFIRIEIPHNNPDDEGTKRWFTISSTPHDGFIQITTRVTDTSFKRALATLSVGDKIQLIEQPDGDFIWQENNKPLIFVAGGVSHQTNSSSCFTACTTATLHKEDIVKDINKDEDDKPQPPFYVQFQASSLAALEESHTQETRLAMSQEPPPGGPPAYIELAVFRA